MSGDELDLDAIEARANDALSHHGGKRWTLDEDNTAVCANLGAGPTVCTTVPLGYDIRRANAAHIAGMDPATTLTLVAEVRRLRAENDLLRAQIEIDAREWQRVERARVRAMEPDPWRGTRP